MGTAPPPGAQGHSKSWLSGFIMLIKVQPEAKKPQTFIRTGHQQHQKLLHNPLKKSKKSKIFISERNYLQNMPPPIYFHMRLFFPSKHKHQDGKCPVWWELLQHLAVYPPNRIHIRKKCPFYKYKLATNKFYLKELTNRFFHFAPSSTRTIKRAKQC